MSAYECPDCGGGFPMYATDPFPRCPWCGKSLDYTPDDDRVVVSRTKSDDDDEDQTILGKLAR